MTLEEMKSLKIGDDVKYIYNEEHHWKNELFHCLGTVKKVLENKILISWKDGQEGDFSINRFEEIEIYKAIQFDKDIKSLLK